MRARTARCWLLAAIALLLLLLGAAPAGASAHAGRVVVSLPGGAQGPLVLAPGQGGLVGEMTVTNVGVEPLTVSRVALRGDEDDVRSPSRIFVHFADGAATSATLAPGASKNVVVAWMPDRDPRVRQAFGHVVVTSTDEQRGEVAMGFRAQLPTGLGWLGEHTLSLLVLWPLVVVAAAGAARLAGQGGAGVVRRGAILAAAVHLVLALSAYHRFAAGVGRADGNDGFQFVERAVWVPSMGAEWYLGVDGTSMSLVVLVAAVWLAGLLIDGSDRSEGYYASLGLLVAGLVGSFAALDLLLLFGAWQVVVLALVMLIGGWGGRRGPHAAAKLAAYAALGSGAMLFAFIALSRASGRAYLVDGSVVAHTLSIPELARTSFAGKGSIGGLPYAQATWALLFVAVAAMTPVVPMHGWLPDALQEAPPGASLLLGTTVVALGPHLLVRVGLGAMPEGARWAAGSMVAIGAFGALWGALCAMAQRDVRRFIAYATVATGGACLYGIGSLTAQGIAGASATLFAHGVGVALWLGVTTAIGQRLRTWDAARLSGLATETPILAVLAAVALGVSMGAPGLAGSWGIVLVLLGGFPRHPTLALLLVAALVAQVAAHLRLARTMLLGQLDSTWRRTPQLGPYGGRLPDAVAGEIAALVPLAALAVVLGLWPAPLLSPIAAGARDTSLVLDPVGPDPLVDGRVEAR